MRAVVLTALTLGLLAGSVAVAESLAADVTPAVNADAPVSPLDDPPGPCPRFTVAQGENSGWAMQPGSVGADLMISNPDAWVAFWQVHTSGMNLPPPPPPIDFQHLIVVAVVQGPQPSAGGPNIAILGIESIGPIVHIRVFDDRRPGPQPGATTNPFHIIAIDRGCIPPQAAISFDRVAPMPNTGVVLGRVLGAQPQQPSMPLPAAHVRLAVATDDPNALDVMTGLDGSYFCVNVPPGEYQLTAAAPGFNPAGVPIQVSPNALIMHEFVLSPGQAEPGSIRGHVARPEQGQPQPLPGALVRAWRDGQPVREVLSNEQGFYELPDLPPGPYVVRASHEGFVPQEAPANVGPGEAVVRDFVLPPVPPGDAGTFDGRVLGARAGGQTIPLPHALVRVFTPAEEIRRTWTNPLGLFVMPNVLVGHYSASAEAPGWQREQVEIDIVANQTTHHEFVLRRPQAEAAAPAAVFEAQP